MYKTYKITKLEARIYKQKKASKGKQTNKQSIMREKKPAKEILLSSFCLDCLLLSVEHTLNVACTPSENPLENIVFSFAGGWHLEIASGSGMVLPSGSPLSTGTSPGSDKCWPCAYCLNLCYSPLTTALLSLEGLVSLVSSIHIGSCHHSASFPHSLPISEERDLMKTSNLQGISLSEHGPVGSLCNSS